MKNSKSENDKNLKITNLIWFNWNLFLAVCYDNHIKGPVKVWKKSIMPFSKKVEIAMTLMNIMEEEEEEENNNNNNQDPVIELRCS